MKKVASKGLKNFYWQRVKMFETKYKSAFIIRTPYHYINALETVKRYNVDVEKSVLLVWSNHFKKRFEYLLEKEKWGKVQYLPVVHQDKSRSFIGRLKNVSKDLGYLFKSNVSALNVGSVEVCFSIVPKEKYIQHVINKIKADKVVIIDEGVGVFEMTKEYLEKRKKKFESRIMGYDRRRNEKCEFFTSYPLECHVKDVKKYDIKRHSFELLKSKVRSKKDWQEGGVILGTEQRKEVKEIYPRFLREATKFIKEKIGTAWYKPHRMETEKQIRDIAEKHDVRLIKNTKPVEMSLINHEIKPTFISGFASTAIHSLKKIYEGDISMAKVFGKNNKKTKNSMAYQYYESLPDDRVDVSYL